MSSLKTWKYRLSAILMPLGRDSFIRALPESAKVLDVGCGNNSPERVKTQRPDVHYTGLDVADYNQSGSFLGFADEYLTASPERFAREIVARKDRFDAVISSHNLEHCDDPWDVLAAMLDSLKSGGSIYLAFPCENSVRFPSRRGALNFHDDPTHRFLPPFDRIIDHIASRGFTIRASERRYRPPLLFLLGLLLEPIGRLTGWNMPFGSTWALYGFESVIWATKRSDKA